jgi:hypothetical protein
VPDAVRERLLSLAVTVVRASPLHAGWAAVQPHSQAVKIEQQRMAPVSLATQPRALAALQQALMRPR